MTDIEEPLSASEFYEQCSRFVGLTQTAQIIRVAWYLQRYKGVSRFQSKDITKFFSELQLHPPHVHSNISKLYAQKKPKVLLCDKDGYYLEGKYRLSLDDQIIKISDEVENLTSNILTGLKQYLTRSDQIDFLDETLNCYRVGAFRAAIVMAWNLAYSHLRSYISSNPERLKCFNDGLKSRFPKSSDIKSEINFDSLTESQVVESAYTGKLISKNTTEILREKLKRRNAAAHPSPVKFVRSSVDDVIADLVLNVIHKLEWQ